MSGLIVVSPIRPLAGGWRGHSRHAASVRQEMGYTATVEVALGISRTIQLTCLQTSYPFSRPRNTRVRYWVRAANIAFALVCTTTTKSSRVKVYLISPDHNTLRKPRKSTNTARPLKDSLVIDPRFFATIKVKYAIQPLLPPHIYGIPRIADCPITMAFTGRVHRP